MPSAYVFSLFRQECHFYHKTKNIKNLKCFKEMSYSVRFNIRQIVPKLMISTLFKLRGTNSVSGAQKIISALD